MFTDKTLEILGYNEIKESIKVYASSQLGKEIISQMMPETNPDIILNRYDEVKEAVYIIRNGSGISLGGINDVTPYIKKIGKGMFLHAEELLKVNDFLRCIRNLKKSMNAYEYLAPRLYGYTLALESFKHIESEIEYCIDGSRVHSRASKTLEKIRKKMDVLNGKRLDKLNKFLTADKNQKYLQENFYSERNGRYVIPIKASYKNEVKGQVIDGSGSGSTVYMEIDEIKDLTVEIIILQSQEIEACEQVLWRLAALIGDQINLINDAIYFIGKFDFIFAKGKYSVSIGGNELQITDDEIIDLKAARHPMLGEECVPLNIHIGREFRTLIITGPNTGGKTITLKTVGLIVLMNQSGILPPVGPASRLSIFNKVLVDIGDGQSIEQSLSTFSGHMRSLVDIIKNTSRRSLVLIDEIGTGTDPKDGAALGIGILEEIYNRGALSLASTHYSKIKEYSEVHDGFMNASMDFDKNTLKPLYKLLIGISGESQALWISKTLGLSEDILKRVKAINASSEVVHNRKINKFSPKKSRIKISQDINDLKHIKRTYYEKGDRVILNESQEPYLVFEHDLDKNRVTLFKNDVYLDMYEKKITLDQRRETLYPLGYDLDQIFISFKKRKLEKDISKGRIKNMKVLQQRLDDISQ
jgi:dsDNA-specific endonuclease/ATPase MutS2